MARKSCNGQGLWLSPFGAGESIWWMGDVCYETLWLSEVNRIIFEWDILTTASETLALYLLINLVEFLVG